MTNKDEKRNNIEALYDPELGDQNLQQFDRELFALIDSGELNFPRAALYPDEQGMSEDTPKTNELNPPATPSHNEESRSSASDASNVWKDILSCIKKRIDLQTFYTWFKPIAFHSMDEARIYLKVPNEYFKSWLLDNYLTLMNEAIMEVIRGERWVTFLVVDHGAASRLESAEGSNLDQKEAFLNPKYTFDTFVVGSCNQFAHAAARAVAERPGGAYNPLYLYGGVGLGKTHLVQAVGHFTKAQNRRLRLAYISAERFMNELVVAIRHDKTHQFRERYRSIDILLMDDIQFMTSKERTQEEFFHTFNALYDSHKQIVITSDCPPKEIPGLEQRLLSRFEWGLIADLQPPEYETRLAIVKRKAGLENTPISDDVADFLAKHIKFDVRELEGALVRLIAHACLKGSEVDINDARIILRDIVPYNNNNQTASPDLNPIINGVAKYFNLETSLLKSRRNIKLTVEPVQIAMYICKEFSNCSPAEIGREFGNKSPQTVLRLAKKVEQAMREDKALRRFIHGIIGSIVF